MLNRDHLNILLIPPNDLLRHPIPNRLYHIAKRLAERHTIYLLTYPGHPLAKQRTRYLKAVEITYPARKVDNLGLYYILNYPYMRAAIDKTLRTYQIDVVVHANILPSRAAVDLAEKYRVPAVYDYLDHYPESAAAYYSGFLRTMVEKGVWSLVQKPLIKSRTVITPSYGLKAVVKTVVPEKSIHVIPNGVDPIFKPMDKWRARKTIGLDYSGYILLLYGSLDVWIDVVEILNAVKNMRSKGIDVALMIVGFSHGKLFYRQLLTEIIRHGLSKAFFTYPSQPYEKMPYYVNSADAVLSPVKRLRINFTTPLKIIESLACGVPVVAPDILEYRIWFKQGVFTYDPTKIEDAIISAIRFREEADVMTRIAQIIMEKYSWDKIVERYINVVKSVVM